MLYVDLFESKAIATFAYDPAAARLVVFFPSGAAYAYENVPRCIFDAFRAAPSKGQYFRASVRSRFTGRPLAEHEVIALANQPQHTCHPSIVLVELARCDRADTSLVFF